MDKIITKGNQTFSVPNTYEGRLFVDLCHKFLNTKKFEMTKKTRSKNRKARFERMVADGVLSDVPHSDSRQSNAPPLAYADWVAIYVDQRRKRDRVNIIRL